MKKWILLAFLLLLMIAGGGGFYILSQPPKESLSKEFKEEAVTKLLGRKAQINEKDVPQGNKLYKGKYLTFEYPAKALIYEFRERPASQSSSLEDLSFDIKSPKLVFNMNVSKSLESVNDIPGVRLRESRIGEYKKTEVTASKVKGLSYYRIGNESEKTGFFVKSGILFTFSVTGGNEEEVGKLFDSIISTVSFL